MLFPSPVIMKFYSCMSPAAYHFRGAQQEVKVFLNVGGHVRVFSRSNRVIQLEKRQLKMKYGRIIFKEKITKN